MGLNVGLNAVTTGGLFIVTILLVIMSILLVSAATKVLEIPGYNPVSYTHLTLPTILLV